MNIDDKPVPGEADWFALLKREVLLPENIPQFARFNLGGSHRFWHLLLLAFRVVDSIVTDGEERTRFKHRADLYTELHENKVQARQELRKSLRGLEKASKELGKALTRLKRHRPGDVPPLVNSAKMELGKITPTHVVASLLAPPFTREKLGSAKAIIENQAKRIDSIEKPTTQIPRRNHRDHAFRALVYLAAAYRLSGQRITVDPDIHAPDGFPAFVSLFYEVATDNFPTTLLPKTVKAFVLMARDRRRDILAALDNASLPSIGGIVRF